MYKKINNIVYRHVISLAFLLFTGNGNAFPGACENDHGNGREEVITPQNINFTAEAKGYTLNLIYSGQPLIARCQDSVAAISNIYLGNKVDMLLTPSTINPGYYQLTNDIDIKLTFTFPMEGNYETDAPFLKKISDPQIFDSTLNYNTSIAKSSLNKRINVSLKLRRDIVGGASIIPAGKQLAKVYLALLKNPSSSPVYRNIFITYVTNYSITIAPQQCRINNNEIINVNFGDINSEFMSTDGSTIVKEVPLTIACNKTIGARAIVMLVANASTFSTNIIKTNKNNVGIIIKENNNVVKPGGYFPIIMNGQNGSTVLKVAPVKNPNKKSEVGDFSASATLILSLE